MSTIAAIRARLAAGYPCPDYGAGVAAMQRDIAALLAERDRREAALVPLLAVVRAVAAWEEGSGRADLLEALEEYDRALAGAGAGEGEEGA